RLALSDTTTTVSADSHDTPSTLQYTVRLSGPGGNAQTAPSPATSQLDGRRRPTHSAEEAWESTARRSPATARLLKSSKPRVAGNRTVATRSQWRRPRSNTCTRPPPGRPPPPPSRPRFPSHRPSRYVRSCRRTQLSPSSPLFDPSRGNSSQDRPR